MYRLAPDDCPRVWFSDARGRWEWSPAGASAALPIESGCFDLDQRLRDMTSQGIQYHALAAWTSLYFDQVDGAPAGHDLPVLLHLYGPGNARMQRLAKYHLSNTIGNPLESAIALGSLVFGGVVERHPRPRIGLVHGGGHVRFQLGRWDHGWGFSKLRRIWRPAAIGTIVGTFVGAIPGAGGGGAALLSYQQAKVFSKTPEEFGKGSIEGLAANESAQSAANSGEIIPALGLGIPTSGSPCCCSPR